MANHGCLTTREFFDDYWYGMAKEMAKNYSAKGCGVQAQGLATEAKTLAKKTSTTRFASRRGARSPSTRSVTRVGLHSQLHRLASTR